MKPAQYRGTYHARSRRLNQASHATPTTRCLGGCQCEALTYADCTCGHACGRTLAQHPNTGTGNQPKWSAGHTHPHDAGAPIRPEVLGCNIAERNDRINAQRNQHTETW